MQPPGRIVNSFGLTVAVGDGASVAVAGGRNVGVGLGVRVDVGSGLGDGVRVGVGSAVAAAVAECGAVGDSRAAPATGAAVFAGAAIVEPVRVAAFARADGAAVLLTGVRITDGDWTATVGCTSEPLEHDETETATSSTPAAAWMKPLVTSSALVADRDAGIGVVLARS